MEGHKDINEGCNKEPLRAHTWLHHSLTMINVFFLELRIYDTTILTFI